MVDFVNKWSLKTGINLGQFIKWLGISAGKFNEWRRRYGKVNEHNSWIPRDNWLESWEEKSVLKYYILHRDEGYRRLTFMMLDEDIVAVSPASVYRVLVRAGVMRKWDQKARKKGRGFLQPTEAHEHWHIDVSYINISSTFYYLCAVLDGYSRYIVHWEIRERMREGDIEIILERSKEKYPAARPRIISDNGPQFIARDFKEYIRISGMRHVRTSPFYPQSNGKLERWHQSLKKESIRPHCPLDIEDARRIVSGYVQYYNNKRLHSAIGYIAPLDKLNGREHEIFADRDRKLEAGRKKRAAKRHNSQLIESKCYKLDYKEVNM